MVKTWHSEDNKIFKMKKFGVLLTILIINFISSVTSKCTERQHEKSVDFNGFNQRDNSNITYLTSNNGTEIDACEFIENIYDCYNENGELIEDRAMVDRFVVLKHYSQNENEFISNSNFTSYFDCVNFLIHDKVKKEGLKIPVRKYLGTENDDVAEKITSVNKSDGAPEIFCNDKSESKIYKVDEKTYSRYYKSRIHFIENDLITFGVNVSIPFSRDPSLSFYPSDEEKKTLETSWNYTRPAQNVTVPANSGKKLLQQVIIVERLKKYTAKFEIDDSLENEGSKRFKVFRQKIKSGEVTLHQNQNGAYFDFSGDDSIVLGNLRVREFAEQNIKIYFLRDAVPCKK